MPNKPGWQMRGEFLPTFKTEADFRRYKDQLEVRKVRDGEKELLSPRNSVAEQIIGVDGKVHVVAKTGTGRDREAIEARANRIAEHKSDNAKGWNPLEHYTAQGEMRIAGEIPSELANVAMIRQIEVDFVPHTEQVQVVHAPSHQQVA